ncbi:MAG: hypothetical protein ACR2IE_15910 [Candidatus Sumerlaeaceae bacterium]
MQLLSKLVRYTLNSVAGSGCRTGAESRISKDKNYWFGTLMLVLVLFTSAARASDFPPVQVIVQVKFADARLANITGDYGFSMGLGDLHLNLSQDRLGNITGQADVTVTPTLQLVQIPLIGLYSVGGTGPAKIKITGRSDDPPASIRIGGTGDASGFTLDVKPRIGPLHDRILLSLEPEISEFGAVIDNITSNGQTENQVFGTGTLKLPGQAPIPVLTRQTLNMDRDGLIIGGLFESDADDFAARVPYLGNLPLVGEVLKSRFKHRQKQNLIILATPNIIQFNTE